MKKPFLPRKFLINLLVFFYSSQHAKKMRMIFKRITTKPDSDTGGLPIPFRKAFIFADKAQRNLSRLPAKIIERVSGKTYRQFMEDEFIKPLELNETGFPDMGNEQTLPEPYLDSWGWLSGERINLTTQNMSPHVGAGNIITSARDLNTFYHLLLSGEAGIKMTYVSNYMMAYVPSSPINSAGYGMGLFHYVNLGYGHGGDGSGMLVRCYSEPASGTNFTAA